MTHRCKSACHLHSPSHTFPFIPPKIKVCMPTPLHQILLLCSYSRCARKYFLGCYLGCHWTAISPSLVVPKAVFIAPWWTFEERGLSWKWKHQCALCNQLFNPPPATVWSGLIIIGAENWSPGLRQKERALWAGEWQSTLQWGGRHIFWKTLTWNQMYLYNLFM